MTIPFAPVRVGVVRKELPVSLQVLGAVGGATKQAVSKSKDPIRWLRSRARRALEGGSSALFLQNALSGVKALPSSRRREGQRGGRHLKRSLSGLALALGVKGETLAGVLRAFLDQCRSALSPSLPCKGPLTSAVEIPSNPLRVGNTLTAAQIALGRQLGWLPRTS